MGEISGTFRWGGKDLILTVGDESALECDDGPSFCLRLSHFWRNVER